MELHINIQKRHLYIFSIVVGIVLGVFAVTAFNPSGTSGVPSNFGHSVDEVDWTKTIQNNLNINGDINMSGQNVLSVDVNNIKVGDVLSTDGKRSLILRSGDLDTMIMDQSGNVGIGVISPNHKLDVNGGISFTNQKICGIKDSSESWQTLIVVPNSFTKENCRSLAMSFTGEPLAYHTIGCLFSSSSSLSTSWASGVFFLAPTPSPNCGW